MEPIQILGKILIVWLCFCMFLFVALIYSIITDIPRQNAWEQACQDKGGVVQRFYNGERLCLAKSSIIQE